MSGGIPHTLTLFHVLTHLTNIVSPHLDLIASYPLRSLIQLIPSLHLDLTNGYHFPTLLLLSYLSISPHLIRSNLNTINRYYPTLDTMLFIHHRPALKPMVCYGCKIKRNARKPTKFQLKQGNHVNTLRCNNLALN